MRKVQGIDEPNEYWVTLKPGPHPTPGVPSPLGFIVKNWTFPSVGSSGWQAYPYLNIPGVPLRKHTFYDWKFADAKDAPGIPGQGNDNPASLFEKHFVVLIDGVYYDPSYGVTHL